MSAMFLHLIVSIILWRPVWFELHIRMPLDESWSYGIMTDLHGPFSPLTAVLVSCRTTRSEESVWNGIIEMLSHCNWEEAFKVCLLFFLFLFVRLLLFSWSSGGLDASMSVRRTYHRRIACGLCAASGLISLSLSLSLSSELKMRIKVGGWAYR